MTYNYLVGLIHLLGLNFPQYLFFSIFIGLITAALVAYVSLKVESNFNRILYLLSYILIWFLIGGLIGGTILLVFCFILYVLIREFSGDYS